MKVLVYSPASQPAAKRVRRTPVPPPAEPKPAEVKPVEAKPVETKPAEPKPAETKPAVASAPAAKGKFTKQQVEWRLRQIRLLFEEGLLTEKFNDRKVAECEATR
jgi:hypothetical protein